MSVFKRATYSKSSGRSWSTLFLEISRFLYLFPVEPEVGTPHFKKVPRRPSAMSQLAFFLNELFCPVHTGRCKWKSFGGGTSMWKATEILIVNSGGTKAACLELYIHILGALAYLSNHQYSGRYSSYENWSLNCNASQSLKYCWSSCPENSAWTSFMPLFLLDKTIVKTEFSRGFCLCHWVRPLW